MEGSVAAANDKRRLEEGILAGVVVSKEKGLFVWNL
jgi:hypothetical protein